jgi:hypothetical protein
VPRILYNEGRVVGYSAYETYVRHALSADPETTPASEAEFLSSTLGFGSSMLLKVDAESSSVSGVHYVEYELPATSRLCGASMVYGSLFIGAGDDNTWSEKVTDFGQLISNTSDLSPSGTTIPTQTLTDIDFQAQIRDFSKIIDGVIVQDGVWSDNASAPPQKTLAPDFTKKPKVRIQLRDRLTTGFYMLLSGFTDSGVIYGVANTTGISTAPQNGDFLGPAMFPWAAKIIFSVPTAALSILAAATDTYTRQFEFDAQSATTAYSAIIDFESADVTAYYGTHHTGAAIDASIINIDTMQSGVAVLATRPISGEIDSISATLPPDLIAGTVTDDGNMVFGPVASYSPYSLHLFSGDTSAEDATNPIILAKLLESNISESYSFIRDDGSYVIYQIDKTTDPDNYAVIPVSDNTVDNANALQIYNSSYVYMYRQASGGGTPSAADLADVSTFIVDQQIYGYVSDEFIDTLCLTSKQINDLILTGGVGDWLFSGSIYKTMYNQLEYDANGNRIYGEDGASSPWVYFLMANGNQYTGASQNLFFVPVNKNTHRIAVMISAANSIYLNRTTKASIDFTNDLEYLGSWWNATSLNEDDPNLGTWGPIEDHPIVRAAIPAVDAFYMPRALVPLPTPGYGYNYKQWYKDVVAYDNLISADQWSTMQIDDSYKGLSIHDFIMKAATNYVQYPMDSEAARRSNGTSLNFTRYIIPYASVVATITDGETSGTFNTPLQASLRMKAQITDSNFFAPAIIHFNGITWDGGTATVDDTDITQTYISNEHELWGAIGQSGSHKTKSISLSDNYGNPLPLLGSSDRVEANTIIWADLLDCLDHNKSLDILGSDIRSLKAAMSQMQTGVNYCIKKNLDGTISLVEVS